MVHVTQALAQSWPTKLAHEEAELLVDEISHDNLIRANWGGVTARVGRGDTQFLELS